MVRLSQNMKDNYHMVSLINDQSKLTNPNRFCGKYDREQEE